MKSLDQYDKQRMHIQGYPPGDTYNGSFQFKKDGNLFCVIASNGRGWDHVSVSIANRKRCPTWDEMCWIKDLFWDAEDDVVQFHPPKSEHVNNAIYCLHLWRNQKQQIELPPSIYVGIK